MEQRIRTMRRFTKKELTSYTFIDNSKGTLVQVRTKTSSMSIRCTDDKEADKLTESLNSHNSAHFKISLN